MVESAFMASDQKETQKTGEKEFKEDPEEKLTSIDQGLRLLRQVLKDPVQVIFLILGIVALIGFGPFIHYCSIYTDNAIKNKEIEEATKSNIGDLIKAEMQDSDTKDD